MRFACSLLALAWMLWTVACNESRFKSARPADPESQPVAGTAAPGPTVASQSSPGDSSVQTKSPELESHRITLKLDLVLAIDTSPSMFEELLATQDNLQKMLSALNQGRLDFRLHLVLSDPITVPADTDPAKVVIVKQKVDSLDAISVLNNLFAGHYAGSYVSIKAAPIPALPFRKDAKLEIVVITDDNGFGEGNLAADFDKNKALNATFNAIVGLPSSKPNADCQLTAVGSEYEKLALASGGTLLDICSTDWTALISRLSQDIVKRSVSFTLGKKPVDPAKLELQLDGSILAARDWVYDASRQSVSLLKTDSVRDGSELVIRY